MLILDQIARQQLKLVNECQERKEQVEYESFMNWANADNSQQKQVLFNIPAETTVLNTTI